MIDRYSITASALQLEERFHVEVPSFYAPRYNAAPTQLLPVITSSAPQGISTFYWGRPPHMARNRNLSEKLINQPAENLMEKPVLKKALLQNRCVIPADSFYVWKRVGKKTAVPYRVVSSMGLFSLAGLWEEFEDETSGMVHTFTLLTVEANEALQPLHHRMPALLTREAEAAWLNRMHDSSELMEQIRPMSADQLTLYTISPRILDPRIDVPSLIQPTPPADQHGNLTLFD